MPPKPLQAKTLYNTVILHGPAKEPRWIIQFKLVRRLFSESGDSELIPWTPIPQSAIDVTFPAIEAHRISIDDRDGLIMVNVDGQQVGSTRDGRLTSGLVGLDVFGKGEAVFRNLMVQDLH